MTNGDDSSSPAEPTLQEAFSALITVLNGRRVRYAIIGGMAMLQHTRVRVTEDIDALLTVPQLEMPGLFESLQLRGFSVDVMKNIREFRDEGMTCIHYRNVLIDLLPAHVACVQTRVGKCPRRPSAWTKRPQSVLPKG